MLSPDKKEKDIFNMCQIFWFTLLSWNLHFTENYYKINTQCLSLYLYATINDFLKNMKYI